MRSLFFLLCAVGCPRPTEPSQSGPDLDSDADTDADADSDADSDADADADADSDADTDSDADSDADTDTDSDSDTDSDADTDTDIGEDCPLSAYALDEDGDGAVDVRQTLTWNGDELASEQWQYVQEDPSTTEDFMYSYDLESRLTEQIWSLGGVEASRDLWTWSPGGALLSHTHTGSLWNQHTTWIRDHEGRELVREEGEDAHHLSTRTTTDRDPHGRAVLQTRVGLPHLEEQAQTAWQHSAVETLEEEDWNADGTTDRSRTLRYDTHGNRIAQLDDEPAGGTVELEQTWSFDVSNRVLTYQLVSAFGPGHTLHYTYGSGPDPLSITRDDGSDGGADRISTLTYDSEGRRATWAEDSDADGAPEWTRTHTYDGQGQEILSERRDPAQALLESLSSIYGAEGPTYRRWDRDGDGTPDQTETWTYLCP